MARDPLENRKDKAMSPRAERMTRANELYLQACEERGVSFASWHSFEAWKEYVEGTIGENQLGDRARGEMSDLLKSFGKYVVIDSEAEHKGTEEKEEKRKRARKANEIYRKVCRDVGVGLFFFEDFSSWSDFVEGKMDEKEFYEKARLELESILAGVEGGRPEDN